MSELNLTPEPEQEKMSRNDYDTLARMKSGAHWFFWIAGLSLVNSLIMLFGGNWSFFAGLAVTQIVDVIILQISGSGDISFILIIAFMIDLLIAGIFVLCGYFAGKLHIWAFVVGMILYALDGVIMLILGAYLPAAFHVFALFMMFKGLSAARELKAAETII